MKKNNLLIAIDGPSASGKSTLGKLVAKELGYLYIDTGAIYRAITWKALKNNLDLKDERLMQKLVSETQLSIKKVNDNEEYFQILVDGKDVTKEIRNPEIDQNVSQLARLPAVRQQLISLQRNLAKNGKVIMEGRDIGSVILPNADIKLFFTAPEEERVRRRYQELKDKGYEISYEEVREQIIKRDLIDSSRGCAPLIKTEDAIVIDSTNKNIEEVKNDVLTIIKKILKSREAIK